ncbi:DUF6884 domain-containing protein [uncultured Treponema sp.]|uniref:DUF6884 domain-containing protein n=1 Tax=uncultured Treponema sp. TaxID=162155 RepID=UPI0025F76635|nr:DUF6884 domain-containing protein [uncultured Treponema sp.]
MKNIALLGCSAHKLGQNEPDKKFKAQDIYTGNTFIKSKTIGLKRFNCEDFHILSAKYGLLDKDDEISYYDMYLGHQKADYRKKWSQKILEKLKEKYDLTDTVFFIFAGSDYYKNLISHLNCVIFGYLNSNTINFEDSKEYNNGGK